MGKFGGKILKMKEKIRKIVHVSSTYTGTRKKMGKWVKPKKFVVFVPRGNKSNRIIYQELKKKKSLKHRSIAWW